MAREARRTIATWQSRNVGTASSHEIQQALGALYNAPPEDKGVRATLLTHRLENELANRSKHNTL